MIYLLMEHPIAVGAIVGLNIWAWRYAWLRRKREIGGEMD